MIMFLPIVNLLVVAPIDKEPAEVVIPNVKFPAKALSAKPLAAKFKVVPP